MLYYLSSILNFQPRLPSLPAPIETLIGITIMAESSMNCVNALASTFDMNSQSESRPTAET